MKDAAPSMVERSGAPSGKGGRLFGLAFPVTVIWVLSLAATWQLYQNTQHAARQTLQTQSDFRARNITNEIMKRMATYEQVMRGVDGLFAHDGSVSRIEFHDYVARLNLKEHYPGIQGIRFSPLVTRAEQTRHVAAMRGQGMAGYAIQP